MCEMRSIMHTLKIPISDEKQEFSHQESNLEYSWLSSGDGWNPWNRHSSGDALNPNS